MLLRHIEAFNAIMFTGTISGAARWMNLSQPAVTRILQHAETQLGYALFNRSGSGMTPTEQGLRLYPQIERLYGDLSATREFARSLRPSANSALRVSVIPTLSLQALPLGIELMRKTNQRCDLSIQTQHSTAILSSVALQEIDVGITFDVKPHPNVVAENLCEATLVCVAPRGEFKRRKRVDFAALADRPVIRLDIRDPLGQLVNQACNKAGVTFVSPMTVQTYHTALALVEKGIGIALIDSITASSANTERVDVLNLVPKITIAVKVLQSSRAPSSSAARQFVSSMRTVLCAIC